MLRNARTRAAAKDIEFNLTLDDFELPERCPVLDIPLRAGDKSRRANSPSLDRMDYSQGYIPGNVIVMSQLANQIKTNASSRQLDQVSAWMKLRGL